MDATDNPDQPTAKELAISSATAPANETLVQLKSRQVRWLPSRYNARATTDEGILVVYNSYSGAVSGFAKKDADRVASLLEKDGFYADSLPPLEAYLAERGFLVRDHADELQRFRHRYAQRQHRPDLLELILLTSEECNFRCNYCYESFPRGTMEPWVRTAVIKLIESRARRLNFLDLSYFGGEPLLGLEAIEEIGSAAKQIAQANDIRYQSSMTTNGYLLRPEVFEQLIHNDTRSFQITLDGTESCHDHNRPLKDGGGTYRQILENLRAMKDTSHKFMVALRINFDRQNVPEMGNLLDEISDFRNDERFTLRFYPIGKWGGPNDGDLEVCGVDGESQKRKLDTLAANSGFKAEGRLAYIAPKSGSRVCYAARPYNLIVGADGKLMKCTIVLDTKDYNIVGKMTLDGRAEIDVDKLVAWTAPYFEDDETCKKCFYLPVCQGASCPLPRIESGTRPCPSAKLQIGPTLTGIWEQASGNGKIFSLSGQNFIPVRSSKLETSLT